MKKKSLKKGFALMAMGVMLFACNKQEEQTTKEVTVETVLGNDLLNEIERANEAQHQLVIQSIEELKTEGEIVTVDQINERIEENAVGFKSSGLNQEFLLTTSLEILQKYATEFSKRLLRVSDTISDDALQQDVLDTYEKEKDLFLKEILNDTSLSEGEKRDIIISISISNARLITQLSVYNDIQTLITGDVETKFFGKAWRWFKKQWTNIVETCAFGVIGSAIGGVSYFTGVGTAVGVPLLRAAAPRLGYCFNKR